MLSSTKFIEETNMFEINKMFEFQGVQISLMPVHQSDGYWLHVYGEYGEEFIEEVSDTFNIYIESSSEIV